jgi:hypothetical protein
MMAKIDLLVEKLDKLVDPLVQAPRRSTESRDSVAAPARFTYKVLTNGSVVACDENGCQVVTGYSAGLFGRQYGYAECVTCDTQSMAVEFRQGPVRRGLFGRRR